MYVKEIYLMSPWTGFVYVSCNTNVIILPWQWF